MTRVLLLQRNVPHYRLPVFEQLGREFDLTLAYSGVSTVGEGAPFRTVRLRDVHAGEWARFQVGSRALAREHDAIITMFNPRWVSSALLANPILS